MTSTALRLLACMTCAGAAVLPLAGAKAQSSDFEPGRIARSTPLSRWTLDFKPGALRLHVDPATGRPYWYFTYMVINRTGEDRLFAPRFELLTDDGAILRSGRGVPSDVVRDIVRLLGNPLIEDQNQIIGELLQGVEHAKEGVVVWPAPNTAVKEMTIFVSGLSGETTTVVNPATGEPVVLAKSLSRSYLSPGDALLRPSEALELQEEAWVWR